MGELHIEVLASRLKSQYKVEAELGRLQVAYFERLGVEHAEKHLVVDKTIGACHNPWLRYNYFLGITTTVIYPNNSRDVYLLFIYPNNSRDVYLLFIYPNNSRDVYLLFIYPNNSRDVYLYIYSLTWDR